ncbi:tRNA nucleotidyltransferase [Pseudodesulfovibrio sp. F-1]|uniref:tRNA nucleotidyltransferase n=1 Tax=Pseudodesulfovibrio alkaliphilus TaxID=2661613 RepID=A0A7K1KRG9_9BACT|nr:HD domain-containing protein [Pseudodesulfovibrio alkaliphilus]MUM78461.1 tRNA nucleotidyltransferase [Pseudodesulfovibrio alkaliphilus]
MNVYLAGGAVRDLLLGRPVTDRDYLVTGATRQEFLRRFPEAREVGRSFPVFLLDGLEFSFPRKNFIDEELRSRDLTVNAMLLARDGSLVCHPNSLDDLWSRTLRPASLQSFLDDPLRVFRAARFWAKMPDFSPHQELVETMKLVAAKGLLDHLPADRVGQETRKALLCESPGNYLRLLAKTNCLVPWFSEFKQSMNIPAGPAPYHDTDVLEHSCRVMDSLAGDAVAVWMGLCHDIGKTITPTEMLPRHFGHDQAGMDMADALARRIRLPNALALAGRKGAQWHMTAARYRELRPGTKVDMLMDLHRCGILRRLFRLVNADQDVDDWHLAARDMRRVLAVRLAPEQRDLGPDSGARLRQLRAQSVAFRQK